MKSDFFIDRPVFSTVLSIIIVIVGCIGLALLPVDQYPQIVPPVVKISASYPGADAQTVSQAVATPIEQELNGTPGMIYMESSSSNSGGFSVTVTFDISTNPDLAAVDIQNRIKEAESRLPAEVVQNGISVEKQASSKLMTITLLSSDPKFDEIYLSNYATLNVLDLLRRIPGVGSISNVGSRYYAMQIWVQPDKLADLGLTVKDHQFLVFSIIAGANSIYISLHNIYRGFPKEAIIGNLFRSLLAIPVSVFYNDVLALFLPFFTTADPLLILEPGAAIISKTASDTVAAIIEGLADWRNNRQLRYWDYETKLQRLFDCYAKLELAFPDQDILSLLSRPEEFTRLTSTEARSLQVESIINALDLMYFWLYQPCAQQTLTSILRTMTREERVIVARSQGILSRVREVSQLFVDGLLGRNFARALSFYLDSYENYILTLNKRCAGFSNGHRPLLRRRRHISDCL